MTEATLPNGAALFDGFPRLVPISAVDYRVANWYDDAIDGQLVELVPGVFTPYNPNVTDLESYLDGPNSGDCSMRREFFPSSGGACWEGVASPDL